VMARQMIGSFTSMEKLELDLNKWIRQYVTEDDTASFETKAKYPLREAEVRVEDEPGKPGCYKAVAFLRPHFQLDELTMSLELVAQLPEAKK
jgi:type VI secretion system protein ImpC